MRTPARPRTGPPAPALPGGVSSVARIPGKTAAWTVGALAALIAVAIGAAAGGWFLPLLVGLVAGWTAPPGRLRRVLAASVLVAVAGWAAPLLWLAARGIPVAATARSIAATAGLPASAALIVAVTLLVAAIQAAAGFWVAHATAYWHRAG
jgi:hypothetical protein